MSLMKAIRFFIRLCLFVFFFAETRGTCYIHASFFFVLRKKIMKNLDIVFSNERSNRDMFDFGFVFYSFIVLMDTVSHTKLSFDRLSVKSVFQKNVNRSNGLAFYIFLLVEWILGNYYSMSENFD